MSVVKNNISLIKVILNGCRGKMGRVIENTIKVRSDIIISAGVDSLNEETSYDFPVYKDINEVKEEADIIIDFSNPSALKGLIDFSIKRNMPLVICTTGFSDQQINEIKMASKKVPIFFSGNMSLGINLLMELSKKAANILYDSYFDIEIVEKHHNQKIDAPSGTALMIADAISTSLDDKMQYTFDRHSYRKKRSRNEIGIHSIRGGSIVGEHEVIFAGRDEVIKLTHSAGSKEIFATGAINAAMFMFQKPNGLYNMGDVLSSTK